MDTPRRTVAPLRGSADPLWWGLTGFLSVGSVLLPKLLNAENSQFMRLMVIGSALFVTGAFVGAARRDRPWRWGVASFAAFAVRDLVVLFANKGLVHVDVPEMISVGLYQSGTYFLYALPVLLGAVLGASMINAGLD